MNTSTSHWLNFHGKAKLPSVNVYHPGTELIAKQQRKNTPEDGNKLSESHKVEQTRDAKAGGTLRGL